MSSQQLERKKREATLPQVLVYLARKTANKWEMSQKLNKSYSNIHTVVGKLLDRNLIRVSHRRRSSKNPKIDVEYYTLTFPALTFALRQPGSWNHIDEIAKEQKKILPLFFGKWQHFKRSGVDDVQLRRALDWICYMAQRKKLERARMVMEDFFIYISTMSTPVEARICWLKAIHDDLELKRWALEEEFSYRSYVAMLDTTFRLIRESKPDWNKALVELRNINRMPVSEELKESLEKEMEELLEET